MRRLAPPPAFDDLCRPYPRPKLRSLRGALPTSPRSPATSPAQYLARPRTQRATGTRSSPRGAAEHDRSPAPSSAVACAEGHAVKLDLGSARVHLKPAIVAR